MQAATPEQEVHIQELVDYISTDILPKFFSDDTIEDFERKEILRLQVNKEAYNGTLKEAFQLISSLQAIIAVLETIQSEEIVETHKDVFRNNIDTLHDFGFSFPFTLEQFTTPLTLQQISLYARPENKYLV
ncbi:YhcU family protein [Bacillus sp. HMF5848]|uniref:YhcU family protein n=1 Tax=Bacillus sp. HMF5848 TaxID=2495421 RepID=UPI0021AD7405|nr:YhcU family protein [Bacillus sp. HMF5848]